jgi:hypothetical protein
MNPSPDDHADCRDAACDSEQTNGHGSSAAWQLESRHAQSFPPIVATLDSFVSAMSYIQPTPCSTEPGFCAGRRLAAHARAESASGNPSAQDRAFIALQNAYRPHGGLSRLHSLPAGGCVRSEGQECSPQDLVDEGKLFGFQWYDDLWIPMFQFDLAAPTVASGPQRVVAELGRGFDGWALASWFVEPNGWLESHCPIECLGSCLPDVLEAARADRFVAMG